MSIYGRSCFANDQRVNEREFVSSESSTGPRQKVGDAGMFGVSDAVWLEKSLLVLGLAILFLLFGRDVYAAIGFIGSDRVASFSGPNLS